jgi:hypothetical protein
VGASDKQLRMAYIMIRNSGSNRDRSIIGWADQSTDQPTGRSIDRSTVGRLVEVGGTAHTHVFLLFPMSSSDSGSIDDYLHGQVVEGVGPVQRHVALRLFLGRGVWCLFLVSSSPSVCGSVSSFFLFLLLFTRGEGKRWRSGRV